MTSSVRVGTLQKVAMVDSMLMTHSGMVRAVHLLPAVNWATHPGWAPHGSVNSCHRPRLTISKLAFVVILGMKIFLWNSLNYTSINFNPFIARCAHMIITISTVNKYWKVLITHCSTLILAKLIHSGCASCYCGLPIIIIFFVFFFPIDFVACTWL